MIKHCVRPELPCSQRPEFIVVYKLKVNKNRYTRRKPCLFYISLINHSALLAAVTKGSCMVTMVTMISHSVAVKDLCNKGTVTCSKHLECVNLYTQILTDVGLLINR